MESPKCSNSCLLKVLSFIKWAVLSQILIKVLNHILLRWKKKMLKPLNNSKFGHQKEQRKFPLKVQIFLLSLRWLIAEHLDLCIIHPYSIGRSSWSASDMWEIDMQRD